MTRRRDFLKGSVIAMAAAALPAGLAAERAKADVTPAPLDVIRNSDGRLEVFAVNGSDIYHKWQHTPNGAWSDWFNLGSPTGEAPNELKAARNSDGRLEIFMITTTPGNPVYHIWQSSGTSTGWSGWQSLGGGTSNLAVGTNADGRLEVFQATDNNSTVQHAWQQSGGGWSGWHDLGGFSGVYDLQVILAADNQQQLFVLANEGLFTTRQQPGTSTGWSGFATLDTPSTGVLENISVAMNSDGLLELFGVDDSQTVSHMFQHPGGAWDVWESMNGSTTMTVHPARNQDGRLEIFVGTSTGVWHNYQIWPGVISVADWSGWYNLSGPESVDPVVGTNADGRLEVFGGGLHSWQNRPNSDWSAWYPL